MKKLNKKSIIIISVAAAFTAALVILFFVRRNTGVNLSKKLNTVYDYAAFDKAVSEAGYERKNIIYPLPYSYSNGDLKINAESAILISADTGDILYEKNADQLIPPASMTKLFLMYTVFKQIENGRASLDDVVPIPESCWASKMPAGSSLMFLGKDHIVTLRELMSGLAVCSGNDASHAIALYLFGDIDSFIEEVNLCINNLGLENTTIVEPSGYSEKNTTTARDMAKFARCYIREFPESLSLFHSLKRIIYPRQENLPKTYHKRDPQRFYTKIPDEIWTPMNQSNTNKLLKVLPGCDGLKTGHIDESGYNLALTCRRNGERYISVTMKGPGKTLKEGDAFRCADGETLQEYAFDNFKKLDAVDSQFYVPLLGAKENSVKLVSPFDVKTVVPVYLYDSLKVKVEKPSCLYGDIECAKQYGKITIVTDEDFVILEAPLIAVEDIKKNNVFLRAVDFLVYKTIKKAE
ncbi:MAG: D-alanyl-D-alanine carboxypeptidase [Treponema sp.]|uniref:D-alanyl-D-alanine carboxypeptidase family protein n=1 Tax=Treponema sp. TaxID=166 RepID=UPI00298E1389|nr:D-alanyl-D-alanine carboxypeptidase family protein [Treponema sp.]MBR5934495.1 D-alanyl-D-alanine carboxypeptidase [Treponema sp.]